MQEVQVKYDGPINLSIAKSRLSPRWELTIADWSLILRRLANPIRTDETVEEYWQMDKEEKAKIKEKSGAYVGGTFRGIQRKAKEVEKRTLITLDADHLTPEGYAALMGALRTDFGGVAWAVYSTHSYTPSAPRLRVIMPLRHPVDPDAYQAIARRVAEKLGMQYFDRTTFEPHRLMYWPTVAKDGEYIFDYQDAPWLDGDAVLQTYKNWKDTREWPLHPEEIQGVRKGGKGKAENPLEKKGIVGAFCKTYTVSEAIETFLHDVYTPEGDGRYTYTGGSSVGGLVVYDDDTLAYSFHATDPAGGRALNAWDIVRIHKFGHLDEGRGDDKASQKAMREFAGRDEKVLETMRREEQEEIREMLEEIVGEAEDWINELEVDKDKRRLLETPRNYIVILTNDKNIAKTFGYNEFVRKVQMKGAPIWRQAWRWTGAVESDWTDQDDAALRNYLHIRYKLKKRELLQDVFLEVAMMEKFHPVREYIQSVKWDGTPRIETVFTDYLGAEDTPYTRTVARKFFVAAIARIMEPGVKFDYMVVLVGPQGSGKSSFWRRLAKLWFSDSFSMRTEKEAYESLHGAWIVEVAELSAFKKKDIDEIKHFLTKQYDSYRPAYGRHVITVPRQSVLVGTTNELTFLRDDTGNRRFLPVRVMVQKPKYEKGWRALTDEIIDQLWAEAYIHYQPGEELYIENEKIAQEAERMQREHTAVSDKYGIVERYLDIPLPDGWENMAIPERKAYIQDMMSRPDVPEGKRRNKVSAIEIWVEAFGGREKDLDMATSREIRSIMRQMPGWQEYGRLRFGPYGIQRGFVRE